MKKRNRLIELNHIFQSLEGFGWTTIYEDDFGKDYKKVAKHINDTLELIGYRDIEWIERDNMVEIRL